MDYQTWLKERKELFEIYCPDEEYWNENDWLVESCNQADFQDGLTPRQSLHLYFESIYETGEEDSKKFGPLIRKIKIDIKNEENRWN